MRVDEITGSYRPPSLSIAIYLLAAHSDSLGVVEAFIILENAPNGILDLVATADAIGITKNIHLPIARREWLLGDRELLDAKQFWFAVYLQPTETDDMEHLKGELMELGWQITDRT